MTKSDEIAALRAEVAELKAQVTPTPSSAVSDAAWRDEMHALAERRASQQYHFSRQELREMQAACPTSVVRDIAMRDGRAPQGPSSAGAIPSSQHVSNIRGGGGGTGYAAPLSNPPGTRLLDAIAIADEVRQRAEKKR